MKKDVSIEITGKMRHGIENGIYPVVEVRRAYSGGSTLFAVFKIPRAFIDKDVKEDEYVMAIVKPLSWRAEKPFRVVEYFGSHPSSTGAVQKFAMNHGLLG